MNPGQDAVLLPSSLPSAHRFLLFQNEKRQLQTQLLVETRIQARRGAAANESFTEKSDLDSDSISDTEGDRDDAEAGRQSDDDEHFMDCMSSLPAALDGSERSSSSSSTIATRWAKPHV